MTTRRSIENYTVWRHTIRANPGFGRVLEATIERQKRSDDLVVAGDKKNLWQSLGKEQEYKQTTKDEFQSLLLKVIYCLIDAKDLDGHGWYSVDREIESLLNATTLMDTEDFIERLLEMGNVSKKRLQATINYYTRSMRLPDYRIPAGVEMPKDQEKRKRLARNKTIVLKDDFIDPVTRYIDDDVRHRNYYSNQSLVRGAIAFNIIRGTGLRITNAYQIPLADLESVYDKGEHKVLGLLTKHGRVDFCYVKCTDKRALRTALDLYRRVPPNALNRISSKSPTRFKDMRNLVDSVFPDAQDAAFKSNMIRNYVADTMLARGATLNKTSKLMNHKSVGATRHYINKFHPGPTLVDDPEESDDDDDDGRLVSL